MGRAGSVVWCAFGSKHREVLNRHGEKKIVSEYALHIQCPWRIRFNDKLLAASHDKFYPAKRLSSTSLMNFNWHSSSRTLVDKRIEVFMRKSNKTPLFVSDVYVSEVGDMRITLNEKYFLELFSDSSVSEEYWRLFTPYSRKKHLIFSSKGINYE